MSKTYIMSLVTIEVHVPKGSEPDSDEAWLDGDWEVKLDAFRDHLEIAAHSAAPAGTTIITRPRKGNQVATD